MKNIFPRYLKETTLKKELKHVRKELNEVFEAYKSKSKNRYRNTSMELLDVIHNCETCLFILEEKGVNVDELYGEVEEKNRVRGYYDKRCAKCKHLQKEYDYCEFSTRCKWFYPDMFEGVKSE